ncbi:MAG: hypothetical protein K8R89_06440, partial [Anaerolineae bacterium]|nr:hypothetical protein [Anaerolineae bacterium]
MMADTDLHAKLQELQRLHAADILTADLYRAALKGLGQDPDATFDQHGQQVQTQTNVGRDVVALNGDANIVGDHNRVLYQVYQIAPGRPRLTEVEFTKVLSDYLGWV